MSALVLIGALVSGVAPAVLAAPAGAGTTTPTVELVAPASARPGSSVAVRVVVHGAARLGAFQGVLRYDQRAVAVARVRTAAGLTLLQTPDSTDATAVAGFTCAGCSPPDASAAATVATFDTQVTAEGRVDLRLDGIVLVARDGTPIARPAAARTSIVAGSATTSWPAPHGPALTAHSRAGAARPDADGDGSITTADVTNLASAWEAADQGTACATTQRGTDVDRDGCLTVADVQTTAARASVARLVAPRAAAQTAAGTALFTVNSTADTSDKTIDGVCQTATPGECTLRAAIQEANHAAVAATIDFAIPGTGLQSIHVTSLMTALTNPNGITIDGFTQPGSSVNTDPVADNAVRTIEVVGGGQNSYPGFVIDSSNNAFHGLIVDGFDRAFFMDASTTTVSNNTITGNMVGLTPSGGFDPTYGNNSSSCVVMQHGAQHNVIGAAGVANRNVLSGCGHAGVATYVWPSNYNTIQNNIIGLDPTGTLARGSFSHGVDINSGSQHNLVTGNVISGNGQSGVEISHNPATQKNSVIANFIGTDLTGDAAPAYAANGQFGVHLEGDGNCNNAPCALDAGFSTVSFNVIVNSVQGGVMVEKGVHDSVVDHNLIGVTANGTAAGNTLFGVNVNAGSVRITIGPGNEIANNANGVQIEAIGVAPPNPVESLTDQIKITQNSIHNNGSNGVAALGIDLAPFGTTNTSANADPNVNDGMLPPTLSNAQGTSVDALTCAGCTVEVFVADQAQGSTGSGLTYLASGVADGTGLAHVTLPGSATNAIITATATNAAGSTSEFSRNVKVVPVVDQPPKAAFTKSCSGLTCQLDASGSTDADGTIVSYDWDFGDGSVASGVTASHSYAGVGSYVITLTVTDDLGVSSSVQKTANLTNASPIATFSTNCQKLVCAFDGSATHDPDGTVTATSWDFGDGSAPASGPTASHTYANPGLYVVTLTATDNLGATGTVAHTIDISTTGTAGNGAFGLGPNVNVNGTYVPVAGDFNGDGHSDILWYAPGTAHDSLWRGTATGFVGGPAVNVRGVYTPIVGDFDGDGRADILWYSPGSGADFLWRGTTTGFAAGPSLTVRGTYKPIVGDFNGDGRDDIFWYAVGSGADYLWRGTTTGFTSGPSVNVRGSYRAFAGDFDGDGRADIFWYAPGTGADHLWRGTATGFGPGPGVNVNGNYLPVPGDYNADGLTDIFWYGGGPGADYLWRGTATGFRNGPNVAQPATVVPVEGDVTGEGNADIFWYKAGTGNDSLWYGLG